MFHHIYSSSNNLVKKKHKIEKTAEIVLTSARDFTVSHCELCHDQPGNEEGRVTENGNWVSVRLWERRKVQRKRRSDLRVSLRRFVASPGLRSTKDNIEIILVYRW